MRRLPPHDRPFAELVARELDPALPTDRPSEVPKPPTESAPTNEWLRDPPRDLFGIAPVPEGAAWPVAHPVAGSLLWCALLIGVFAPLAVRRYASAQR